MRGKQVGATIAVVLLAVLGWAYWDGGMQPLVPIEQAIETPAPAVGGMV